MARISYILFFVSCFITGVFAQQHKKLKVLFLGNSYTYVNNLPQLIKDIALANGDTLVFDSNCPGGQTFHGHFLDATSISKINSQTWDCVVLQAQSQEPSFDPSQVETETLPYAIKLDSVINHNNSCTETVFYETWGRKNGDASNCAAYPPICTYIGMQNRLKESYKLFADTTHSTFSPAGEAFRKSIAQNPTLELYSADQSHPSLEGSYLTACVFYEVLFHKSVLTNTYTAGVSAANVAFLQQVAHSVVNDSLSTWNIGKYTPWAPFTYTLTGSLNYQFTSQSPNASNKWYFGDGTTSLLSNPTHVYANSQNYTVSHVVSNACSKDSSSMVLNTTITGLQETASISFISVYPNPAENMIHLAINETSELVEYKIYDVVGKQYLTGKTSKSINITSLPSGVYFIEVQTNHKPLTLKFTKHD